MDPWVWKQHGYAALIYTRSFGLRTNSKIETPQAIRDALNPCLDGVIAHGRVLETKAAAAIKANCGNCDEQTAITMGFLANAGVSPRERMTLFTDPLTHVFVVIGRKHGSTVSDPSTWGDTAVVIDPWHRNGKVFFAKDFQQEMFRGAHNFQGTLAPAEEQRWGPLVR